MNLNDYAAEVHKANAKWWVDIHTGEPLQRNFGELIALCHSELSEALEGHRKNLQDDKLPNRKMAEVELVDCIIRILDIGGSYGMDLQGAYEEKMACNGSDKDLRDAAGARHASAERVRELIAKWRKQAANISELIPVSVEVQSMGKSCAEHADELERALDSPVT